MRRREDVGLAAFCLLAGSRWLVENAWPGSLPPLAQQTLHSVAIGLVALVVCVFRRLSWDGRWVRLALAGVLLLAVPALLNEFAGEVISQAGAALFTLVPLFVVVAATAFGDEEGSRRMMFPALVAAAGGLLLLPFQLPSTGYGGLLLGVMRVGGMRAAGSSVWLHGLLRAADWAQAATVGCFANGLLLGSIWLVLGRTPLSAGALPGEIVRCLLLDTPTVLLLFWLLREMSPAKLASRYLLAPLVTVVEGIVFLRPRLDPRMAVGALLMVAGGMVLLARSDASPDDVPPSLHLG